MSFTRAKPLAWTDDLDPITAAQQNQIDLNQSRALDGTGGGAYSPAAALDISGAGLRISATSVPERNVMLGSRTVRRQMPLTGASQTGANWYIGANHTWANAIASAVLWLPLDDMPQGNVLQTVTIRYQGDAAHVADNDPLQIAMPIFNVYRVSDANVATLLGTKTDTTTGRAAYITWHDIEVAAISHALDLYNNRYIVSVTGEAAGGADPFRAGAQVCQLRTEIICTRYTEY